MTEPKAADGLYRLTPAVSAERMLANMRSAIARNLPLVPPCRAHGLTLSVAGGGPSLADTYQQLEGCVAAVNGTLKYLLDRGVRPSLCGIMDAGEHMADMIVPHPKVSYLVASICDPSVFDKLKGCDVRLWHISPDSTDDQEGVRAILDDAYDGRWTAIGGGCTMGLRWIDLGYFLGFRKFALHGLDSSFREGATHAYPDRADTKDRIEFNGRLTRPNFLAQVYDFFDAMERFSGPQYDDIQVAMYGDGLLQDQWREHCAKDNERVPVIACVKVGAKYGNEYVTRLRDGVARHLKAKHEFICFTDDPVPGVQCSPLPSDLPGWWSKIGLFRLKHPLIYFDLDVVITGDLSPLLKWYGFSAIQDWWQPTLNSSVMVLNGTESHVWDRFKPGMMSQYPGGDQEYITTQFPPNVKTFPQHWFPSYKANSCFEGPPEGAMAVIFHGRPKMADLGGWVADAWRGYQALERPEYPAVEPAA